MTPETLLALATARGVALDADALTSGSTDGGWSLEDVALAARGLYRHAWLAALYSLAGDDSVSQETSAWLLRALRRERRVMQWASKVERIDGQRTAFDRELVRLFLLEERRPQPFRVSPHLYPIAMRVERETWDRTLRHQYLAIAGEYLRALMDAEHHVRRALRGDSD